MCSDLQKFITAPLTILASPSPRFSRKMTIPKYNYRNSSTKLEKKFKCPRPRRRDQGWFFSSDGTEGVSVVAHEFYLLILLS
jgi:hypothetical protein